MDDNSPTFNFADNNFRLGYNILGTKYDWIFDEAQNGIVTTIYDNITHLFTDDLINVYFLSINATKEGFRFSKNEKYLCNVQPDDDYAFLKKGSICSNST